MLKNCFDIFMPRNYVRGKTLLVRSLRRKEHVYVKKWFEDIELLHYAFGRIEHPEKLMYMSNQFQNAVFGGRQKALGVIRLSDKAFVGIFTYNPFHRDKLKKAMKVGIVLGDKVNQEKGLGVQAVLLGMQYILLNNPGIEYFYLDTATYNIRGKKCFEKCGFVEYGQTHEINYVQNKGLYEDKILMKMSKERFLEKYADFFD